MRQEPVVGRWSLAIEPKPECPLGFDHLLTESGLHRWPNDALLVDAAGEEPFAYSQQVTGHEAGRIGCQEHSSAAKVIELSEPPHGRAQ